MKTELKVKLLAQTTFAEEVIYAAFRQCYSKGWIGDKWTDIIGASIGDPIKKQEISKFIQDTLESGHESPIEHISFTFAIAGISRALSHQLVRHRIASYSQQSQRYTDSKNIDYIMPPNIEKNVHAKSIFMGLMDNIASAYESIQRLLIEDGHKSSANEDARFVLPNACETMIVVTMNARSLWNFFNQRCCRRAQWEIRSLADVMLLICKDTVPSIFNFAGPKCEKLGYCPESEKFTCGKYPTRLEAIKSKFHSIDDVQHNQRPYNSHQIRKEGS
jgi:thymidylate synthase (FAD)